MGVGTSYNVDLECNLDRIATEMSARRLARALNLVRSFHKFQVKYEQARSYGSRTFRIIAVLGSDWVQIVEVTPSQNYALHSPETLRLLSHDGLMKRPTRRTTQLNQERYSKHCQSYLEQLLQNRTLCHLSIYGLDYQNMAIGDLRMIPTNQSVVTRLLSIPGRGSSIPDRTVGYILN